MTITKNKSNTTAIYGKRITHLMINICELLVIGFVLGFVIGFVWYKMTVLVSQQKFFPFVSPSTSTIFGDKNTAKHKIHKLTKTFLPNCVLLANKTYLRHIKIYGQVIYYNTL